MGHRHSDVLRTSADQRLQRAAHISLLPHPLLPLNSPPACLQMDGGH
jgi:hypothetical protein